MTWVAGGIYLEGIEIRSIRYIWSLRTLSQRFFLPMSFDFIFLGDKGSFKAAHKAAKGAEKAALKAALKAKGADKGDIKAALKASKLHKRSVHWYDDVSELYNDDSEVEVNDPEAEVDNSEVLDNFELEYSEVTENFYIGLYKTNALKISKTFPFTKF